MTHWFFIVRGNQDDDDDENEDESGDEADRGRDRADEEEDMKGEDSVSHPLVLILVFDDV